MRNVFREDHEQYREQVRRFVENEIAPHHAAWEKNGAVSREAWLKAGKEGILLPSIPEEYGGGGGDFGHSIVVIEELVRVLAYPKFRLAPAEQQELLADYLPWVQTVRIPQPPPPVPDCRDPLDLPFMHLAVAGQADILVVPDLESGNMVAKQLEYLADALMAGVVLGARVPIVLTSRADTAETRTASCAIAQLMAHKRRQGVRL